MNAAQLSTWAKAHKPEVAAGGAVALGGLVLIAKKRAAAKAATTGITPAATGTAGPYTADTSGLNDYNALQDQISGLQSAIGGLGTTPLTSVTAPPAGTSVGAGGTPTSAGSTSTTPTLPEAAATALGFTNPNTPVELLDGTLLDTGTGRPAYYGPGGQPGGPVTGPIPAGDVTWTEPGGVLVEYNPNSYAYGDPSRPPDLPPGDSPGSAVGGPSAAGALNAHPNDVMPTATTGYPGGAAASAPFVLGEGSSGNPATVTKAGQVAQASSIAEEAALVGPGYNPPGTGGKPSYYNA